MIGVLLGLHLAARALDPAAIGVVVAAGLAGGAGVGAAMKIAYDLLLWRAFRGVRPPEEIAA